MGPVWRSLAQHCRSCFGEPLILDPQGHLYCPKCGTWALCVDCGSANGKALQEGWYVPEGRLCVTCANNRRSEPEWYVGPLDSMPPSRPPPKEEEAPKKDWLTRLGGKLMCWGGWHTDGQPNPQHFSVMTCIRCGKDFTL